MRDKTLSCPKCATLVAVDVPNPNVANYDTVSVITSTHSDETMCPKCNEILVPVVTGANLSYILAVIPPEKRKKMVVPVGIK